MNRSADYRPPFTLLLLFFAVSIAPCFAQSRWMPDIKDPAIRRKCLQYNLTGNAYYARRNYRQAIAEYSKMVQLAPQVSYGYFIRGMVYNKLGDYDHAIQDDTKAIQRDHVPASRAAGYYNRAVCYKAKRDWDHAIADLTQSLREAGDNTDAYEVRGDAYYAKKSYRQAIADYSKAYQMDSRHTQALYGRAQCYLDLHDYSHALPDYELYARVEAGHAESWGVLAWAQYLAGKMPEAIANNKKALAMNARLTFARFNLALCYAVQGDWSDAQQQYRTVLRFAQPAEVKAGLQDVRDAMKKQPNSLALKQSAALLEKSVR